MRQGRAGQKSGGAVTEAVVGWGREEAEDGRADAVFPVCREPGHPVIHHGNLALALEMLTSGRKREGDRVRGREKIEI